MFKFYRLLPLLVLATAPGCTQCGSSHSGSAAAGALQIEDLVQGTGVPAKKGKTVTVHILGRTADGQVFQNTKSRGTPLTFVLGEKDVIPGLQEGIEGMLVTGKRRITVPPALGFKNQDPTAIIPPNSSLTYEVELLDVK